MFLLSIFSAGKIFGFFGNIVDSIVGDGGTKAPSSADAPTTTTIDSSGFGGKVCASIFFVGNPNGANSLFKAQGL